MFDTHTHTHTHTSLVIAGLLMSVESNSGAADAGAAVTWSGAEVAATSGLLFLCSRASTRESSSNCVTAS